MSEQLGTCQSKKYFHAADRPHRENGNCWFWKPQPSYFSSDSARCKNCGKVDNMHHADGTCPRVETGAHPSQDAQQFWYPIALKIVRGAYEHSHRPILGNADEVEAQMLAHMLAKHAAGARSAPSLPAQDAIAEQSDEGRYSPDPPTFEMQARWLLWWRKYCDNDQSEAPTTCTADLAQTFAEWLVKRESPNFMPYPLERKLRNRISELEARTERVNRGPLCDNCGKSSRLHYCWRGDDYKGEVSTYHPSELRGSTPSPDPPQLAQHEPCGKKLANGGNCADILCDLQMGHEGWCSHTFPAVLTNVHEQLETMRLSKDLFKAKFESANIEIERLREALREIESTSRLMDGKCKWHHSRTFIGLAEIADKALAPSLPTKEGQ